MATCINSSRSCLPPFYTIPIFPHLNRKIFHLLVSFLFFAALCILSSEEYNSLRLLFTHLLCLCRVVGIVCTPTFIATIANMGQFYSF